MEPISLYNMAEVKKIKRILNIEYARLFKTNFKIGAYSFWTTYSNGYTKVKILYHDKWKGAR